MEEEVDPILNKLNGQPAVQETEEVDPILQKLNSVKKKESGGLGGIDFIEQQRVQLSLPKKPSPKSSEENTDTSNFDLPGAWRTVVRGVKEMVAGYDQPADPKDVVPSPFVNAVKRGLNLAEQAELIGPESGSPTKEIINKVADLQKETKNLPASEVYTKFNQSKTFGEALSTLVEDPVKIIAELTGESLAAMAKYGGGRIAEKAGLAAGAGAVVGSAIPGVGTTAGFLGGLRSGAVTGMAETSLGLEYTGSFLESLEKAGVDVTDPKSLEKAFSDDKIMGEARSHALKKGVPIAIFDLISGGVAGKIVSQPAKSIIRKVGAGAAEFGVQAAMGAGGELAGQVVSGEEIKPGAIVGEAIGELGTTPVEVGLALTTMKPIDQTVVEEQKKVDVTNPASLDVAAEKIEQSFNQDQNVRKPSSESVLQRQPGETGEAGSERQPLESGIQGPEITQEDQNQKINEQTTEQGSASAGEVEQPPTGEGSPAPNSSPGAQTETGSIALDQPEEQKLSGIKKALVSEEKIAATPIERRSTEQMLQQAKQQVDAGEVNPKAIVDEISQGNARALQADEVSALVYYKTQLDNKSDQLNADMLSAIESNDVDAQNSLRPQIDTVNQEIDRYQTMALKTAYEQSLAFRLRQMLLDNEYNLQTQINKYKVANKGHITPEVEQRFKDLDTQLKAANAKLQKLEEQRATNSADTGLQAIRQGLQKQKEKRAQSAQQKKDKINQFFDSLKVKADPNKLNSITQVIGEAVYNGSVEVVRAAVLAGSDVATAIKAGIDYVREHYKGEFDQSMYADTLRPLESIIPPDKSMPSMVGGKLRIPESVIRSVVEGGAKNITEVVDQVENLIKSDLPDVSKREIRDAITKYGETRNMSKEEIDVKIREIKRTGRLVSSLEDVQNKKRPLRSGLQRDKLTDEERRLQREIKEGMKNLPVDLEEEAKAWKNSLDAIKSRLTNQIADIERQIQTGEKTPKKKGVEYDAEAKQLQERRDALKKILEATEGKQKLSDEQRLRQAVTSTQKQIDELERRINQKDVSGKTKSPAPTSKELTDLRKKRDDLRTAYQEMEKELGVTEKRRLDAYKKAIQKSIASYEQRIKDQDFVREKKKPVVLDEEATRLKLERDKIKQQFDVEQEKARLKNRPMNEKIWDTVVDVFNLPKSFLASIDMSAPFRQGAILSVSNPGAGRRSFVEMFRQAFSEKNANEWLLKLKESPEYAVMKAAKLYIAEPTAKLTAKEENFISNLAGRIPLIGPLVKGSERAYTGYLNKLRTDVFANGADRLREQGITLENNPEAYKQWANFINNATGRGNLGGLEMAAPALNALFFSPRYVASRINLLNPATYAKMPAPVRKMALKNFAAYLGFGTLFLTLAAAAGADVEEDPRSSDFGKIKVGDTRYDIWAGFQQVIRLMAQVITGQRKSTKTGEITELSKDKFPYETRGDVALRFLRSKLSPTAGTIANLAEGENIVGEEVTIQGEAVKNVVPLYLQDIKGIYDEEGATGVIQSMVPAFFGIGVQSYGEKSGLTNKELDPGSEIQKLNKERKYSISQPSKSNLTESLDHEVDEDTYDKFFDLRDKEIKRQFDRYKLRLEGEKDVQIYDKLMDQIVKEAGRHAKYMISRENGWRETAKQFNPGKPFRLRNYKKNEEGKVVPR